MATSWQHNPIGQITGAYPAVGNPFAFAWERDSTQHVVYLATDGQIHELWQRRGQNWQHAGALSQMLGAPPAAGDPRCFAWEKDGTQHILYRGQDKQIHELWQRQGKPWAYGSALSMMAAAPAAASDPDGFAWENDGTQHVVYRSEDGEVQELWQRQGKPWTYGGALSQVTGSCQASTDPDGFAWEDDNTQHIVYVGTDNQIHELWQRRGQKWEHGGSLTAITKAPAAASRPAYFAWQGDGTQHIVYRAEDNHVHEIWFRKGKKWEYGGSLTGSAGAPLAAGRPFGYAWEKDGTQHVVYRGQDNQIHEMWFRQGKGWAYGGSLNRMTNAPVAASDPMGYAWEGDGSQHIIYRGADNMLHELWMKK